jgi:hypothetical protein
MEGNLTMRQAVALQLQKRFAGEVSWKFGHASFETAAGKVYCFITRDGNLAMKLPQSRIAPMLESAQGKLLRMGKREMREWLVVGDPESAATLKLLPEARAFVDSLPQPMKKRHPAKKSATKKSAAKKSAAKTKKP